MGLLNSNKLKTEDHAKIVAAITEAEKHTSGEIRVHFSYISRDYDVVQSAKDQFNQLKMHETRERNGILLYINPTAKKFAVYGDEGIHQKVGQTFWDQLASQMSQSIQGRDLIHGITVAVTYLGHALAKHFPHDSDQSNELSNQVSETND